jgi:hypothetical protein
MTPPKVGKSATPEERTANRLRRAKVLHDGGTEAIASFLERVEVGTSSNGHFDPTEAKLIGRLASELLLEVPETPDWFVRGLIARGWAVKHAAREKTGKGTHDFYLLGRLERCEPTVYGPAYPEPVSAVIYTEEPADSIREKVELFGITRARIIYGWELGSEFPTWQEKSQYLIWVAQEESHEIIFVDNISRATGAEDENGVELARAVEPFIEAAKAAGKTVLADHHHKKGAGKLEDKSRGGTALAAAFDNNIEQVRVGDWTSHVRQISSRGRLRVTNWQRKIALSEDGRSYDEVAGIDQPQSAEDRKRLRALVQADDHVTAKEFAKLIDVEPSGKTAARVLNEFVGHGWASRVGSGKHGDPYRWLPTDFGIDVDSGIEAPEVAIG